MAEHWPLEFLEAIRGRAARACTGLQKLAKRPRESVERTAPYAGSRNDRTILEARL